MFRDYLKTNRWREPYPSINLSVFVKTAIRAAKNFVLLQLNNAVSANRSAYGPSWKMVGYDTVCYGTLWYASVRHGHGRRINLEPLLYVLEILHFCVTI